MDEANVVRGGTRSSRGMVATMVVVVLAVVQSGAATVAAADEPIRAVVAVPTPTTSYVLVHAGRKLEVTALGGGADGETVLSNGRCNCPRKGYAILAEGDGSLLVVRYRQAADGSMRYTVRHVDADGRLEWTRELATAATETGRREIAFAVPARATR